MKVLVDTSIWSLALRRRPQDLNPKEQLLVNELADLMKDGRATMLGLVRQELLSGIKSDAQFETLRKTLRAFPDEAIESEDHEAAARFGNACRSKGIAVSVVDILICAVAERHGMPVFSTDPDFPNYARAVPIKLYAPKP